jgi:hypothetical protein
VLNQIELEVVTANEPSDYIYENFGTTYYSEKRNECALCVLLTFLLALVLVGFTYLKMAAGANTKRYPPTFDCSGVDSLFGSSETGTTGKIKIKFDATEKS